MTSHVYQNRFENRTGAQATSSERTICTEERQQVQPRMELALGRSWRALCHFDMNLCYANAELNAGLEWRKMLSTSRYGGNMSLTTLPLI